MSDYEVHVYQCSFCKSAATSTYRVTRPQLKCQYCLRFMAFKYSSPVSQAEWLTRSQVPPEFRFGGGERQPYTKRPCDECRTHVEKADLIVLSGVGKFCSEDCAQVGVLKHEQFMQRVGKLKQERPGLWPVKESA